MRWRVLALTLAALAVAITAQGQAMPPAAQALMGKAQAALSRGDGAAAQAFLQRSLGAGAGRADVAAAMGEAMLDQGDLPGARTWLAKGAFAPAEALRGWRMLARLEMAQGNLGAAGKALDRGLALAPRDSQLWVDIAHLRYAGGEQIQALDAANRAVAFDPGNPRAIEIAAQLVRDQQGPQAALPVYEAGLSRVPRDQALREGYAATLGATGRYGDMLAALREGEGGGQTLFLEAVLAAKAGDTALARSLIARAGGGYPQSPAARVLKAVLDLEAGNANLAADEFDALLARQPANQRLQLLLASALFRSGQFQVLIDRYSSLAARRDTPPYLLMLMGRACEQLGNRRAAAAWLDRAAALTQQPEVPLPPNGLSSAVDSVRAALVAGQFARAEQIAEALRKAHPGSADAQALAGEVQLALQRDGPALDRYAAAAQIRATDALVLRMAGALERSGRGAEAAQGTARYLAAFPASPAALRLAARQHALAGDWPGSVQLLEPLVTDSGRDARLLADLSFAQARSGAEGDAVNSARRAWRLQPASALTAQAYAMALIARGDDPVLARQLLDSARALGGDNPLLDKARADLGKAAAH